MNEDRPVYLRLRDNIAAMILEGRVRDGDPLPSVRSLAADYGANPLTVAKAYQTFQEEGLVLVKRGVGMFVAPRRAERLRAAERKDFLENRWPGIVSPHPPARPRRRGSGRARARLSVATPMPRAVEARSRSHVRSPETGHPALSTNPTIRATGILPRNDRIPTLRSRPRCRLRKDMRMHPFRAFLFSLDRRPRLLFGGHGV